MRPGADAVSVYVPLALRRSTENVATPPVAVLVVKPLSVPPAGPVAIAIVTVSVAVATRLPCASVICTVGAGVIGCCRPALLGCTPKRSCAAAPAEMTKPPLAGEVHRSSR